LRGLQIQPHSASLEMAFYEGSQFPGTYRGGVFAAEHGSWNRTVPAGYEVIFIPFQNGRAIGSYMDFLTGFIEANGRVWGRPVGVAFTLEGALTVSDDGSNSIWRVSFEGK
jgi:glucose/arabinose dehydrogenase